MEENPEWPGLFLCPDGKIILNDTPPVERKCTGISITQEAADAFDAECLRIIALRN